MSHVIAVLEQHDDHQVVAAAESLAHLLGADSVRLPVPDGEPAARLRAVLDALGAGDVVGAALTAHGADPLCWELVTRTSVPVLVVPRACEGTMSAISRVLLPLDGSAETAACVADVAHRALDAGASVVATHVFNADNVPAFWDQVAHTQQQWTREFLLRNLPEAVELDLRRGGPADEVMAEATRSGVDLVVVGWAQDLAEGRAATVRHALTHGRVPVLLVGTRRGAAGP